MSIWDKIRYEFNKDSSPIRKLIIINISVFLLAALVRFVARGFGAEHEADAMLSLFHLPSGFSDFIVQPWSLVTYMFFHGSIRHIFYNLLILYFVGRIILDFINNRQFLTVFFGGGIAGGVLMLLVYNLLPWFDGNISMVGASGGVYAVLVATAVLVPNYEVYLFGVFRVKVKWIALVLIGLDIFSFNPHNLGGHLAHLGGILFGGLYILNLQGRINLDFLRNIRNPFKPKFQVVDEREILRNSGNGRSEKKNKTSRGRKKPAQEEIDAILDKIGQSGYDSLSKEEKELLFRASE